MATRAIAYKQVHQYLLDHTLAMAASPLKLALLASTYHPVLAWAASTAYAVGDYVQPTTPNSHYYRCTVAGTSGATEPGTWPTTGGTVADGTITWEDQGLTLPITGALDSVWADVSAHEVTGPGYTAGGQQLTGVAITPSADATVLGANLVEWLNSTITARWAVLYQDDTLNGIIKPLISCILLDDTPGDVETNNATFSYPWSIYGVYAMNPSAIP